MKQNTIKNKQTRIGKRAKEKAQETHMGTHKHTHRNPIKNTIETIIYMPQPLQLEKERQRLTEKKEKKSLQNMSLTLFSVGHVLGGFKQTYKFFIK